MKILFVGHDVQYVQFYAAVESALKTRIQFSSLHFYLRPSAWLYAQKKLKLEVVKLALIKWQWFEFSKAFSEENKIDMRFYSDLVDAGLQPGLEKIYHSYINQFEKLLSNKSIDMVVLPGEYRLFEQALLAVLNKSACPPRVLYFEAGPPGYIYLDAEGVNANASFAKSGSSQLIAQLKLKPSSAEAATVAEMPFWVSKSLMTLDLCWLLIVKLIRGLFDLEEYWLAAINRLRMFNRRFVFKTQTQYDCQSGRFIIFIGQVRNDINHTHFGVNDAEIEKCLSTILSADQGLHLMWRDHPLELSDHTFNKLSKEFPYRVFRAKQISLQQAMKSAEGVVTVNSNGGLEALAAGLPVRLLGRSYFGTLSGVCRDNESFEILREKNRELGPNKLIQADAARFINDCFLPIDYRGGDFNNAHLAADLILLCNTQNSQ